MNPEPMLLFDNLLGYRVTVTPNGYSLGSDEYVAERLVPTGDGYEDYHEVIDHNNLESYAVSDEVKAPANDPAYYHAVAAMRLFSTWLSRPSVRSAAK